MLKTLLDERFFNSCLVHEKDKRNEENCFCMDCGFSLCFHCMTHHRSHRILQIRRYMYNDVLRWKDAHKIFDCSLIQTYITNSERVVLLRRRHGITIPIRGLRSKCLVCGQSIKSIFVYCSMVCKFSAIRQSSPDQRVCAYGSKDHDGSLLVFGSAAESLASVESTVEGNLATAAAAAVDETNYESMVFVEEECRPEQKRAATSSNGGPRKFRGRKCFPHRSPLF